MACFHPLAARRSAFGGVALCRKTDPLFYDLGNPSLIWLPCGACLGCRKSRAREWAFRCTLELDSHNEVCWCTLTYADSELPPTLQKRHLQLFLKSLRKLYPSGRVRFFATGEYGDRTFRPHYHAILYGVSQADKAVVERCWKRGLIQVDTLTPASISYVAGYCAKKIGVRDERAERIDYRTGELYQYQPPFIQMSRKPGIGATARRFVSSWRSEAIFNGNPMPVPRYLHEAWKSQASDSDIEVLAAEKLAKFAPMSSYKLSAVKADVLTRHSHSSSKRDKL